MVIPKFIELLAHSNEWGTFMSEKRMARFSLMVGWELPANWNYSSCSEDVPSEIAAKILALDYGERSTDNLRIMGEQMGKVQISVPSNINVWGHTKGTAALADAAQALTSAVQTLAKQ